MATFGSRSAEIPALPRFLVLRIVLDYRCLAMGLRMRDNKPKTPPKPSYKPTMRPQDFFAVVDLYRRHEGENGKRRKEVLSSFTCSIDESGLQMEHELNKNVILKGPNPYSASFNDSEEFHLWREKASRNHRYSQSVPYAYAGRKILWRVLVCFGGR